MNLLTADPSASNERWLYVFISLGFVVALLFFVAESVLGALGLRAWYNPVGITAALVSLSLIPFVLFQRRLSHLGRVFFWAAAAFLIVLFLTTDLSGVLFLIGWAAAIFAVGWIPASAVAILSVALLVVQFRLALRCTEDSGQIARLLILGACFFGAGYFLGVAYLGDLEQGFIMDRDNFNNHQYYLYVRFGWLDDPDHLALYECTSTGLFCEVTYVAPSGDYNDRQFSIELDRETQVVGVQVDDRFSPRELTEADVGYLCDFFQIADEDSFCARPFFQDYASFRRMLRRNVGGDFSYPSIVPYFIRTGVFDVTTCPPPDTVLSSEQSSYTCRLDFPANDLVLELRMIRSSYGNEVWYNVRLVNPNCNCDNR